MYNIKNHPTNVKKKHENVVHQINNSTTIRAAHKNDNIIGMVLKNLKPKIISPDSALKSPDRNTDSKAISQKPNFMSHQIQSSNKSPVKRKYEKVNHSIRKKIRSDNPQKSESTEGSPTKKQNKLKCMFPKTYICKYCCRRYHSVEQLKQHTSTDHADKPTYVCHLCSHQAASFSALMTHYLKHSGNKRDNVEKIYAKSKADFSNIQFNIFSRPKSSLQCNKCKLSFSSKSKYEAHNCPEDLKKSEYNCAYCGHVSTTVEDYGNHIQTHSETPYTCSYCKFKAMTKKQFDSHREHCKKRQKSNVEYKCSKCNIFQAKSKKVLNLHLKNCGKDISSYTCVKCHSEFQEKKSYECHILECKNKDKQKLGKKRNIKHRKKFKLSAAEKNKLLCSVCDHASYSQYEHEEHEKQCLESENKSDEKTTSLCLACGSTIEIGKLAEHKKICCNQNDTRSEEKPLNIDIHGTRRSARLVRRKSSCLEDEDVKKPKRLKIKILKNPKILLKPKCRKGRQSKNTNNTFLCNFCDFTFCSKSTLLRHKRMHSGNPWYICQYCGKFFFRKDVYIRHEVNVHKKNLKTVFCCYYCKLCFGQSTLLQEHVVAKHKDSAFLPIKHVSVKGHAKSIKTNIIIKEELDLKTFEMIESNFSETKEDIPLNKKIPMENASASNLSSFKCSICFQVFQNTSGIHIHMLSHGNVNDEISNTLDSQIEHKPPQNINKLLSRYTPKVNESIRETSNSATSFTSPEKNRGNVCDEDEETGVIDNEFSDIDEFSLHTNSSTELSQPLTCKLCSQEFTCKKHFEAHSKTVHKIVDWYQCLVCTACGPKQEILEHMLMHMYKVGSFVVGNKEDYDKIISSLQTGGQQKKSGESSDLCNKKQNTSVPENVNLVSDDGLPPLREYGLCPCVDSSFVDSSSKQNEEHNEKLCPDKGIVENLVNVNEAETFDCFQGNTESCADVNNGGNTPSNDLINASTENHSATLDTQDMCNKSNDTFEEKDVSKIGETSSCELSTPVKEYSASIVKSNGNSMEDDCNQTENFSQLRYLLQSPSSTQHSPEKNLIYPFSQLENPSFNFDKHNMPLNLTNQESLSSDVVNAMHKNELNFEFSKQSVNSNESSSKMLSMQENNQSITTCLKFDVNQSRSVFSENLITPTSNQKIQNCAEMDKNESFFKACPSQSPILDFSDLIQHSFENSSPSDDIFSYATPKQVDSHSNIGMREEVRTPDCTDMVNYDSSGYNSSVKCECCNTLLVNHIEQINHKCLSVISEQCTDVDCQYKSKNTFQSLASVENQIKIAGIDNITDKRTNTSTVEKQTGIFMCSVCAKVVTSEAELSKHQKAEHGQSLHNPSHNNECTKCHRTFTDIGELMKHSLTCLKTYFLKSAVNDCLSPPESVQPLLRKDESKTSFSSFSLNSSSPFNAVPTDLSHQTSENLLKQSFNS